MCEQCTFSQIRSHMYNKQARKLLQTGTYVNIVT